MKELQNQDRTSNLKLFIFQQLKRGLNPKKISKKFNLSETRIYYHLSSLKENGFIKKRGYGVWEILKEFDQKQLQKITHIAHDKIGSNLKLFKADTVRGHAFQFTFSIDPKLRNWKDRAEILKKLEIKFKDLKIIGGGQSLVFKGRKVWLTNKSIVIFEKSSYMAETSKEARQYAIYDFISFVGALERYLKADFGASREKLRFKVSRQHYALIKNALAKQYDQEGKKLYVTNEQGRWFIIDNSFDLHEAETIHPRTADQDNKKVQDFFNGIKQFDDFTPQFIVNSIGKISEQNILLAENVKSHLSLINEIKDLVQVIKKIKEKDL